MIPELKRKKIIMKKALYFTTVFRVIFSISLDFFSKKLIGISRNILMIVDEMFEGGLTSKKSNKPHKYIRKGIS